jgi:hypothetical protein
MTRVKFISTTPIEQEDCPCGWGRSSTPRQHADRHLEWARGVHVPDAVYPALAGHGPEIAVVRLTGSAAWRRVAYQLARLAQRDGGYDFPSSRRCMAAARTTRRTPGRSATCSAVAPSATSRSPTCPRSPDMGSPGQALLDAAAEHTGAGLGGMSWTTPFTEAGTALARSCAGPDGAVWIA